MQMEEFGRRKPLVEAEIFRQKSNLPADFDVACRRSQNKCFAAAWLHQSQQHFDRGALPRAVGAREIRKSPPGAPTAKGCRPRPCS